MESSQYAPERILKRTTIILLFSMIWGLVVPGAIAIKTGTFSEEILRCILREATDKQTKTNYL
jgi:hypothetical protein